MFDEILKILLLFPIEASIIAIVVIFREQGTFGAAASLSFAGGFSMKRMTKRVLPLLLAALMVCALLPATALAAPSLTIRSEEELRDFAAQVNAGRSFSGSVVTLETDITLNRGMLDASGKLKPGTYAPWTAIGTEKHPFQGEFDGKGHTITGLYVNDDTLNYQGLFGVISGATVCNVTVKDGYLSNREHAGGVVGYAKDNSVVASCHNDNTTVINKQRAGGIVGWTDNSHVYNCSGQGYCYSDRCSGGIIGDVYRKSKVYNCYSAAVVEGKELVGGISGGTTSADIQNCILVGSVAEKGYLIAGGGGSRTLTNCFALQNDQVNTGLTIGTSSKSCKTFATPAARLAEPMTVNGKECTTVLEALNAWVSAQKVDFDYSPWVQTSLYPYLRDGVTSAIRTSFGSEVSEWSSSELEGAYRENLIPDVLVGEDLTRDINRAEFAAVCVRVYENLAGTKALPAVTNPFVDCQDVEVLKAYNLGVTNGSGANTFSPYTLLNREQAATMLTRTFKRVTMPGWSMATDGQFPLDYTKPAPFRDDGEISDYAKDSVYFMAANGIIGGIGNNTFAPRNITDRQTAEGYANATREQALVIAMRMVKNLK